MQVISIAFDREIEAPSAADSCQPDVVGLVVFLRPERWMPDVFDQEFDLLIKGFSHVRRCVVILSLKTRGVEDVHRRAATLVTLFFRLPFLCKDSIVSSAVEKGPKNWPFLICSLLSAICCLTTVSSCARSRAIGTSLAIGTPDRLMTISSPSSTRTSRREKWVCFADVYLHHDIED